jgi:ubiquinone/menaquinone biosynthesis C-methylase UbiE
MDTLVQYNENTNNVTNHNYNTRQQTTTNTNAESEEATKQLYNQIAKVFDVTRVRIWPCVRNFIDGINSGSIVLDIGCGNGKNMAIRPDVTFKGVDLSDELVKICKNKGLDVIESNMTSLPFSDNSFDCFTAVASYHHLSDDESRQKALGEMYRILKDDGQGLIVVWAMEQPDDSTFNFKQKDERVKWSCRKTGNVYWRYYHIYQSDDLINEITRLEPRFKIKKSGWEKGNWYVYLTK